MTETFGLSIALFDLSIRTLSRITSLVIRVRGASDTFEVLASQVDILRELLTGLIRGTDGEVGVDNASNPNNSVRQRCLERYKSVLTNLCQLLDSFGAEDFALGAGLVATQK